MSTQTILWTAEQVCGECGEGVFILNHGMALCTACDHEHAVDRSQLGADESYEWRPGTPGQAGTRVTLHVTAYGVTDES